MLWQAAAAAGLLSATLARAQELQWTVSPTYTVCATATLQLGPASDPTPTSSEQLHTAPPPEIEHPGTGTPDKHRREEQKLWDIYVYNMGVPQWSSVNVDTASYSVGSELQMQSAGAPTASVQVATDVPTSPNPGPSPSPSSSPAELNGGRPVETQALQTQGQGQGQAQAQASDKPKLDGGASHPEEGDQQHGDQPGDQQQGDQQPEQDEGGEQPEQPQQAEQAQATPAPEGQPERRRLLHSRALINMTLIEAFGGGELQWQVNVPPGLYRLGAISTANGSDRIASEVFAVRSGNGSACVPASFLPKPKPALDWRALVGIVVGGVAGIVLVALLIWLLARKCKKRRSKPLDDNFWHMYYPTRIASPSPSLGPYPPVPDYSYYGTGNGSFTGSQGSHGSFKPPVLPLASASASGGGGPRSIRSLRSLRSKANQPASDKMDLDSAIHVTYNAYGPGTMGTTPLERQVQALVDGSKNDVALEHELRGLFRANQKEHYSDLEAAVMTLLDEPGEKPLAPQIRALYETVLGRRASSAYSGFTARESLDTLRTQRAPPVRPARPVSSQLPDELGPQVQLPAHLSPAASTNTLLGRIGWRRSQQQEVMRAEVMRSPDGEKEHRVYHHLNYNNY